MRAPRVTRRFGFVSQLLLTAACMPLAVFPPHAMALPTGGTVAAGNVAITTPAAGQMNITQAGNAAIVNWSDFSIGAGETVNINQAATAALLNRVTGANPSALLGQLNATGRVYLVNPNGVLVGQDARIDAGSFVATTAQISDQSFLAGGDLTFAGGSDASIVNLGVIKAREGDAVLVASRVVNQGEVSAPNGTGALGAATEFVYSPVGDTAIRVVSGEGTVRGGGGVDNSGVIEAAQAELQAAGGNVYELAINQSGIVRATGIEEKDGRVLLTAAGGTIRLTGTVSAHQADGAGGEVLVGGDFHGANPDVANAGRTLVGPDAVIDVSAQTDRADGGTAVVWADNRTDFNGRIDARAGATGGDGGSVEVSGKLLLNYNGLVDLRAPAGQAGSLLLDPVSLEITDTGPETSTVDLYDNPQFKDSYFGAQPSVYGQQNGTTTSILLTSTLQDQLALGNVVLDTSNVGPTTDILSGPAPGTPVEYTDGSILVSSPITWTSGNRLTFNSGNSIYVNASINAGTGNIRFKLGPKQDAISNAHYTLPALNSELVVAANAAITAATVSVSASEINDESNSAAGTGPLGRIAIAGALDVGTFSLDYDHINGFDEGVAGEVTLDNAANKIGELYFWTNYGYLNGLKVVDSEGGLEVSGLFYAYPGTNIDIVTTGDLTLSDDNNTEFRVPALSSLSQAPSGFSPGQSYIALAARGGAFINNSYSEPVFSFNGGGRFLIYSANPANDSISDLVGTPLYNHTYDANAPATITQTGDRFVFELAPVLTIMADNQTREYGDANPKLTYTVTGLVGSDTAAEVYSGTPTVATTLTASSAAGSNLGAITVSQTGLTLSDYNYGFAGVAGNLTITPAPLTITPNAATRVYGAANPTFTGTITGLKNGETVNDLTTAPTYTPSSTATSSVGTYNITAAGAASPNYTISYGDGTGLFSITPAALTITVGDTSRIYGAGNPTFTTTFTGLTNGDTSAAFPGLTLSTTATAASSVGGYTIDASGATNSNYAITYDTGTLTINPAALTITANSASREYGAADPTFTADYSGFVLSDTSASLGTVSLASDATVTSSVGSGYSITPSGATNANYTYTYVPADLSITPAPLTITAADAARLYGASNPLFTANYLGFLNSESSSVLTSPVTFTTTAVTNSPVGTYAIVPSGAAATNYSMSYVNGTLTINPASLMITANDAARLYGAADPSFSATYTGLVAGDTASAITGLTFSSSATSGSSVGSYTITPTGGANSNYTISFTNGALTINPAPLTVTASSASIDVGAALPDPSSYTATFTGLVAGDVPGDYSVSFANEATNSATAGNYAITPSGVIDTNYAITYINGVLSIGQGVVTVTADDLARIYGGSNPTFTASYLGFLNGDTSSVLTSPVTFTTTAVANSPVGTYAIVPSGAAAAYYSFAYVNGTLTINPAHLMITANNASRLYGVTNPSFSASYSGLVAGDTASVITGLAFASTATMGSSVGNYAITPSGATNSNYTISYTNGSLAVTPAPLTVTANNATRTYGAVDPTFNASYSGLLLSDTAASLGTLGFATNATATSAVGSGYTITPSGLTNANYSYTYAPGALSITPALLTVTPNTATRTYGAADPMFTGTITGFKNGETASVLTTAPTYTPSSTASSSVGTYSLTASGAVATNYTFSYLPGTGLFSITPAALTITANDATRLYGGSNPAFSAAYAGLTNGDTSTAITGLTFSTTAAANSSVGNYTITPAGAANSNYTISFANGTLAITPAPLTVTADNATREYGAADPSFSASYTGLVLSDTIASLGTANFATDAVIGSSVGNGYSITPSGLTNSNYSYTYLPGTLSITPAPLQITADNASRVYGDANPTFSATYTGLRAGDTSDAVSGLMFNSAAVATSGVGNYALTPSGATAGNYNISYTAGQLAVTQRPLVVAAPNPEVIYGDALPALSATITGLASFDTESVVGAVDLGVDGYFGGRGNVGNYTIYVSVPSNSNYSVSYELGTLSVVPRPVNLVVADSTRTYGFDNPVFRIASSDLSSSFGRVEDIVRLGTNATTSSYVGTYAINATVLNPNFELITTPGTLTINPIELHVVANNATRIYGDWNPFLFTYSLVNTVLPPGVVMDLNFTIGTAIPTDANSPAGFYKLVNQGSLDSRRFTLASFQPGIMTVLPRPVTLAVNSLSVEEGATLSGLNYSASIVGGRPGDTVSNLFPNLSFVRFDGTVPVSVVASDYAQSYAVEISTLPSNYLAFGGVLPTATETLTVPSSSGLINLGTSQRFGIAPVGNFATANPNYVVTNVRAGALSVTQKFTLTPVDENLIKATQTPPLVVHSAAAYQQNFGAYIQDYPSVGVGMVTDYLTNALSKGALSDTDSELFKAIFGDNAKPADGFDATKIRTWLADAGSDQDKRILLVAPFATYLRGLQDKSPSAYTTGESYLVGALQAQIQEQRTKLADTVLEAQRDWLAKKGSNLADTFDGTQPYGDFIRTGVENYMVEAMSGGAVGAVVAGATAGAVAAAGSAGAGTISAVGAAIFPFHAAAGTATAGLAATGPAAIIVAAVTMSIVRGIQLGENMKEQADFNAMTNGGNGRSFANLDLDPNNTSVQSLTDQLVFGAALNSMLGGS